MARSTYHHGDLRRAALAEASAIARGGGPDAVTLREVARRLAVSPAAIYRHFPDRDALLGAVASNARRELARRMLEEMARVEASDPRARAINRFQAVGRGYLRFAVEEPNLLAAAFLPIPPPGEGTEVGEEGTDDPSPWHVLAAALDQLVAAGAMPPARREGAESIAWSAVHGFATLRASGAFLSGGEPEPDPEALLAAIGRSLEVR